MKECPYCGAEYPDDATECLIDKTPFEEEAPLPTLKPALNPAAVLVAKCALGIFLINTGIYCAVGRTHLIIFDKIHPDPAFPAYAHQIIMMYTPVKWLLNLCFLLFTFLVCRKKCRESKQTFVVTVIVIGLTILVQKTFAVLAVPAFFLGLITNSSAGYLIGSAIQIVAGAWLLGWFNRTNRLTAEL
jgi:hypothetical protein